MGFVTTLHDLTRRVAVLFIFRLAQLQQGTSYAFLFSAWLNYTHNYKRVHAVAILVKHDTHSFNLFHPLMQLWVVIALWATAGFAVAVVLERLSSKSFVWLRASFEYERRNLDAEAGDRAHCRWLSLKDRIKTL